MSSSSAAWLEFMKKGNAVDYKSAEWDHIPDVARPEAGVYAISFDPIIIAFNKLLLPEAEWPKSLGDLSALAQKDPDRFAGKIGVQEPMGTLAGVSILAHQIRHVGEEKDMAMFKILGPMSQSYRSAGPTYEKILSGEYLAGFNLSAIPLFPRMSDPNQSAIIGWVYPADGTVAAMRNFALAPTTKNPNSAKLLIDFILSKTGQESVSAGGLMPFRTDIELAPGNFVSYAAMEAAVGKENLIPSSLDPAMLSPPPELRAKVRAAFNLPN
jgi:iron(III) transport system substrate-binding protein